MSHLRGAAVQRRGRRLGPLTTQAVSRTLCQMAMWVGMIEFDLRLGEVHSLKDKRSVLRPLIADVRRKSSRFLTRWSDWSPIGQRSSCSPPAERWLTPPLTDQVQARQPPGESSRAARHVLDPASGAGEYSG